MIELTPSRTVRGHSQIRTECRRRNCWRYKKDCLHLRKPDLRRDSERCFGGMASITMIETKPGTNGLLYNTYHAILEESCTIASMSVVQKERDWD